MARRKAAAIGLSHLSTRSKAERGWTRWGWSWQRKIAGNAPADQFRGIVQALPRHRGDADPAMGYLAESLMSAVAAADGEAKQRLADFLDKRAAKISHG